MAYLAGGWPDGPDLEEILREFNYGNTFHDDEPDDESREYYGFMWMLAALPYGRRVALGSTRIVPAPAIGLTDMGAVADFLAADAGSAARFTPEGACVHELLPLTGLILDRPIDAPEIDRTRDLATWAVCLADKTVEWDTPATSQDYTAYWQGAHIAHQDSSYATHLVNAALVIEDDIRMSLPGVSDSVASDVRLITCGVRNILDRGVDLRDDDAIIAQLLCLAFVRFQS
jgi:hypothetical protein